MRLTEPDHLAYLRAGLDAARVPCDDGALERLAAEYATYREQADELLAVPLDLVPPDLVPLDVAPALPQPSDDRDSVPDRRAPALAADGEAGPLEQAVAALRAGEVRSVDLLEQCLVRADALDPELGSYLARYDERARSSALEADARLAAGDDLGPLHGIPIAVKDNLITRDGPTTAQSDAMPPTPLVDAEAVRRLRAAGAVITGKLTLMEFATGLPDPGQRFPTPRNPWDLSRWSGGSSSGSANGVSAGLFYAALGTDTGGSIRNPAAFCGVTGFKPTYDLVPRAGMVPLAPSLDCVGPIARSAGDCAVMMTALAPGLGPEPRWTESLHGLRIGVDRRGAVDVAGSQPGVVRAFDEALEVFRGAGARVTEVEIPHVGVLRFIMRLLIDCERFAAHGSNLRTRWDDYSPTFQDKVRRGVFGSGVEVSFAHQVRVHVRAHVDRLWAGVDVIASPTSHYTSPPVEGLQAANRPELQMTAMWSVLGHPAVSVPMGYADDRLPIGLQLAGPWHSDLSVLAVAAGYQSRSSWHLRRPAFGGDFAMVPGRRGVGG
jgi:aspartyl-tRNA(Asn)/glutamyl-tRNA(Gln) amidotransferase subunit A